MRVVVLSSRNFRNSRFLFASSPWAFFANGNLSMFTIISQMARACSNVNVYISALLCSFVVVNNSLRKLDTFVKFLDIRPILGRLGIGEQITDARA